MDVHALQATLRQFAAQRGWQQFHTPKNLSMALMVEAAELLEIFQWMTPEQSLAATKDPASAEHIAQEMADVMIYLLQLSDLAKVDLDQAVRAKLLLNAHKHPPRWKQALDEPDAAPAVATHVLLDYENVQPTEQALRQLVPAATHLWVFHGPHQKQVAQRFAGLGPAVTAVPISRSGKNALDFHLSYYMGYISSRHPDARIVVVANDTGYGPVLDHAEAMGFAVQQLGHGGRAKAAAAKPAAEKAAARKAPARKAPSAVADGAVPAAQKRAPAKKASARTALAKQALAKKAVIKTAPAKAPAAKKAAVKLVPSKAVPPPKAPVKSVPRQKPLPGPASTSRAKAVAQRQPTAASQKLAASLRKMGEQRPAKAATLKRMLKSLLGASATDDEAAAAFKQLVADGVVGLGAGGKLSYPGLA